MHRFAVSISAFSLGFLSTACATLGGVTDVVVKRAPFDLDCNKDQIKVTELSSSTMGSKRTVGASGCGRKAVYIVTGNSLNGYTAVLNSPADMKEAEK